MKTKSNIHWVKIVGLVLGLAGLVPAGAQARPQWDSCVEYMNSRGDKIPRYNHSRHMIDNGSDYCWGHGRGRYHVNDRD